MVTRELATDILIVGDFIYIKPGVPHEVFNIGDEPLIAFVARSTADEWDKIVDYPSRYRPIEADGDQETTGGLRQPAE